MSNYRSIIKPAAISFLGGVLLSGGVALAQTAPPPAAPPQSTNPTTPNAQPPTSLGQSVVPPPRNVDPGMVTPPPANTKPTMPVIKPPVTTR